MRSKSTSKQIQSPSHCYTKMITGFKSVDERDREREREREKLTPQFLSRHRGDQPPPHLTIIVKRSRQFPLAAPGPLLGPGEASNDPFLLQINLPKDHVSIMFFPILGTCNWLMPNASASETHPGVRASPQVSKFGELWGENNLHWKQWAIIFHYLYLWHESIHFYISSNIKGRHSVFLLYCSSIHIRNGGKVLA